MTTKNKIILAGSIALIVIGSYMLAWSLTEMAQERSFAPETIPLRAAYVATPVEPTPTMIPFIGTPFPSSNVNPENITSLTMCETEVRRYSCDHESQIGMFGQK